MTTETDEDPEVWFAVRQNVEAYQVDRLYRLPLSQVEELVNSGLAYWAQP